MPGEWVKGLPVAITVCDEQGTILELNDKASAVFAKDGGAALVGRNVLDCHPEPARSKLADLLATGASNCYTIEKAGRRKLIAQVPWSDGDRHGLVELSIELPEVLPHFVRGG